MTDGQVTHIKGVRVDKIGFKVVLGEDKNKFNTRSVYTIRLLELLDKRLERLKNMLLERRGRMCAMSRREMLAAETNVA